MTDSFSRRDWIKTVGVASAGALVPLELPIPLAPPPPPPLPPPAPLVAGEISDLVSTSEVFTPPRGRGYMKFSFDFPEPSVAFADLKFSFLVFTEENTYGLDRAKMSAQVEGDSLRLTCDGFVWAGGQEKANGKLVANLRRSGTTIEWSAVVEMDRPIKTITTVVRGLPRGAVAFGGGPFGQANDNEWLAAYPFGGGDLNGPPASMSTPIAMIQASPTDIVAISPLDTKVRPKRFFLQPGEQGFRLEAIYEHDAWRNDKRIEMPAWRILHAPSIDAAMQPHMEHLERAFNIPTWESRTDAPAWMRRLAMATTLHGMHYTGYMFNDYAKMLEILRWMNTQIPADRVLVFIAAWDGRYYWDYPNYKAPDRMGGEAGFKRLISEGQRMGFKMMPMFGMNSANKKQPGWSSIAGGITRKIDGDEYNLNWVDWNNDRHMDAWLGYMNLGADSWRTWVETRIADCIERYRPDAYFLDIAGGHVNSTTGDMHEGTRRLVIDLRAKYPQVACVGEMPYDALHGFIPLYHAGGGARWQKYSKFFQHLSLPAPGRGSTGVHEAGWGRFDPQTLMMNPNAIPTLNIVDDTFTKYRDVMSEFIKRARERAGA